MVEEEASKEESNGDLPNPRFDMLTEVFDEIDDVLAKADEKYNFSVFELEILMLMLRKKVEFSGLNALVQGGKSDNSQYLECNSGMYK